MPLDNNLDFIPPDNTTASSDWVHDYHPSKIQLLQEITEEINNILIDLDNIEINSIPQLKEKNEQLIALEEFVSEENTNNINNIIEDISLRKAIITTFVNGNPQFNSEYYPELIEDGNNNFSNTSICFILNE